MHSLILYLLGSCILTACVYCAYWTTPESSDVKYACNGSTVSFPWRYQLSYGESVSQIQWFYKDTNTSNKLVAVRSHNVFLPIQEYSQRVSFVDNGGIVLRQLKVEDSGNYSVNVSGRSSNGSPFCLERFILLQVSDDLQTNDSQLHITLQDDVIFDQATQQWSLVLSCGHFTFIGQPAFPVEWLTPSGVIRASSAYQNGRFDLHIREPLRGGSYVCRVPQEHMTSACLHDNQKNNSLSVDRLDGTLRLMEAELRALRQQKLLLDKEQIKLNSSLQLEIQDLAIPRIHFNVQSTRRQSLQKPNHIKFDSVMHASGEGFDLTEGTFTAPSAGTYVFYFHTRAYSESYTYTTYTYYQARHQTRYRKNCFANAQIMANSREICRAYIHEKEHGSCFAIVHMSASDKVWVQPYDVSRNYFEAFTTSFSGFLLAVD